MQSTDDSALLRQYAGNNSEEAFAALVARYINLVYSVALRQVGNPHHAEEITQAVFIILAKKAGGLRHDKALSSWLFQTTRLMANNFVRSEIRRQRREQEAFVQSTLSEPGNEAWPGIAPLLDTAVAGLNEKDRRAILLRFYDGKDLGEVGTALGASEDTAKKRVSRAVEKLRRFFTKRGIALPAAALTATISANSVQAAPAMLAKTATAVAFAKGATASGSTLLLVKGSLKIMAWTKAKTAIITGVIVLLVAGTTIMTIREIEAHGSLTVRMYVDGSDIVKVRGNELWIEHGAYLLPTIPVYLDGTRWTPSWNGNTSAKFTALRRPFHPRNPQQIKLKVAAGRGRVSIAQLPNSENDQTLSVLIDDKDYNGMDWYEFNIVW